QVLNFCIVKDQFGFILHHRVLENESDVQIAVPIIQETKERFGNFNSSSFDKGFHSPDNQKKLAEILENVILPRKGWLSAINQEIENSEGFRTVRRKHAAVESSINALENHGLDRCPDHGLDGFKRYVGLAVSARNIQIMGHAIQQKKLKKKQRLEKRQHNKLPLAA
ncbi:MAG: ISNCY family transposase, partial [Chloroflexi bacterium]|nr:ISNCY family transposase [Chloroflexota bacterium]